MQRSTFLSTRLVQAWIKNAPKSFCCALLKLLFNVVNVGGIVFGFYGNFLIGGDIYYCILPFKQCKPASLILTITFIILITPNQRFNLNMWNVQNVDLNIALFWQKVLNLVDAWIDKICFKDWWQHSTNIQTNNVSLL